jgi:hypothetical protein
VAMTGHEDCPTRTRWLPHREGGSKFAILPFARNERL